MAEGLFSSNKILTISQLTAHVRGVLERDRLLQSVWVRGEISDFKFYQKSGHLYFNLKDENSSVNCVMFRGNARNIDFQPGDGLKVIARGYISIFEKYGRYQYYVEEMEPDGLGGLFLSLQQLKERLEREGLFDAKRKRPIPQFADCLGIVTSGDGAALRDIVRIVHQRHPGCHIVVAPAAVQGAEAPAEIARSIEALNQWGFPQVLIVGRGGGSIEDLWAFNTEQVVRAIAESKIPVISAVGHEVDFSLADFAADARAATPTQAGQLAVPDMIACKEQLHDNWLRMCRAMERYCNQKWAQVDYIKERSIWKRPEATIDASRKELQHMMQGMKAGIQNNIRIREMMINRLGMALDTLSPLKVLERGYVIARLENGTVVRSIKQVEDKPQLTLTVRDGEIQVQVKETKAGEWK
ncbi:MAG: exodeoxyribonuclease VII large subunit [Syntrophomonadaceae bacterium]|nr:exodeoxyribonuclease VII large subunit [Syntrophomonadaceae bacterium]